MPELIPIRDNDGIQAVMGRDLHTFLNIGKDYSTWFKDMCQYGFVAGQDFSPISGNIKGAGRPRTDHIISLDMAKEISMIQRTDRGKQARQYFIECERRVKESVPAIPQTYAEALRAAADHAERAALEAARADKAERRAVALNNWKRASEAGDGLKLSDFRTKYFTSVPHRQFFEHLYQHKWIRDERTSTTGKEKEGPNHMQPLRKANDYLYRHEQGTYGDKKRLQTRVKPTNEIGFRDALISEGLTPNTHSTGLVLIDTKELSA